MMAERSTPNPIEWLPRTIAVLLLMVLPAAAGNWLDGNLGTKFLAPLGLVVGMVLGTTALLVLAKLFIPEARGKPIPFDNEEDLDTKDVPDDDSETG